MPYNEAMTALAAQSPRAIDREPTTRELLYRQRNRLMLEQQEKGLSTTDIGRIFKLSRPAAHQGIQQAQAAVDAGEAAQVQFSRRRGIIEGAPI